MNAILLRRLSGNRTTYSVRTAHSFSTGVGFRDAITDVVRFVLRETQGDGDFVFSPPTENELLIEKVDSKNLCIHRHDGEFMPYLCRDEAIAFVTTYLLTGEQLFEGFKNYEANLRRWNRWNKVAQPVIEGLLAN